MGCFTWFVLECGPVSAPRTLNLLLRGAPWPDCWQSDFDKRIWQLESRDIPTIWHLQNCHCLIRYLLASAKQQVSKAYNLHGISPLHPLHLRKEHFSPRRLQTQALHCQDNPLHKHLLAHLQQIPHHVHHWFHWLRLHLQHAHHLLHVAPPDEKTIEKTVCSWVFFLFQKSNSLGPRFHQLWQIASHLRSNTPNVFDKHNGCACNKNIPTVRCLLLQRCDRCCEKFSSFTIEREVQGTTMSIKEVSTNWQEVLKQWKFNSILCVFPFGVYVFRHNPHAAQRSPEVGEEKSERPMNGFPDCKTTDAKQSACTKWQQWLATQCNVPSCPDPAASKYKGWIQASLGGPFEGSLQAVWNFTIWASHTGQPFQSFTIRKEDALLNLKFHQTQFWPFLVASSLGWQAWQDKGWETGPRQPAKAARLEVSFVTCEGDGLFSADATYTCTNMYICIYV